MKQTFSWYVLHTNLLMSETDVVGKFSCFGDAEICAIALNERVRNKAEHLYTVRNKKEFSK